MKTMRRIQKELEDDLVEGYQQMVYATDEPNFDEFMDKFLKYGKHVRITDKMLQVVRWSRKWTGLAYGIMIFNIIAIWYLGMVVDHAPVIIHMFVLLFVYVGMLMYDGYVWDKDYRRLKEARSKLWRIEA